MAEDGGADRPGDEADGIDGKGVERTRERIVAGKIELGEDQAAGQAVKEEIVPLDGGADGAGNQGAQQMAPMLAFVDSIRDRRYHGHARAPIIRSP
jgi:hypothetical protein